MRISWKWLGPVIGALALAAVLGAGWWWQGQFQEAASAGKRAASAGVDALATFDASRAKDQFTVAGQEFRRARGLLGPGWVQGVPWVGHQVAAAAQLTEIGDTGSTAGAQLADLLVRIGDSGDTNRLRTIAGLAPTHLEPALDALAEVGQRTDGLSTDGLVPPLADAIAALKSLVASHQGIFDAAEPARDLVHYLFGSQHQFVLLSQNSAELRPVGGFVGTYGLVTIGPDGFRLDKYQGIYRLPSDTLNLEAPAGARMTKQLRFRDANWWIDLPTSARQLLQLWDSMKQPKVDGLIAIDVVTLKELLTVFGPVQLPGTNENLTSDNAVQRLTEFVEFDRASEGRVAKAEGLVPLVKAMLERIEKVPADRVQPLLKVILELTAEKHIQLFSTDPTTQAALVELALGGAINPPADTTDLLVSSNAMVRASKSNLGVSKAMDYQVALAADGSADTQLRLDFAKTTAVYPGLPTQLFSDYLRVYRSPGTRLASGRSGFVDRPEDGRPVFATSFELAPGAKHSVQLQTRVEKALTPAADGNTARYRLLVVRQADLAETAFRLKVQAPDGWRFSSGTATWRPGGGDPVAVTVSGATASLTSDLTRDLIIDLELTRG